MHWAAKNFHNAINFLRKSVSSVFSEMLFEESANGSTPLMVSALNGTQECLQIFLYFLSLEMKEWRTRQIHLSASPIVLARNRNPFMLLHLSKRPGLPSLITLLKRWWTSTASWEPSCRGTASSQGYRERRLRKPLERPPQGCLEVGCQTREVYSSSLSLMKKEKKFWRGG